MSFFKDIANFFRPDDTRTTEERLDAFLRGQEKGFAAPKAKKMNLSIKTAGSPLTKATQGEAARAAAGANNPNVIRAMERVFASSNRTVQNEMNKVGITITADGPRVRLNTAGQAVPLPPVTPLKRPSTAVAKHTPPKVKTLKA